MKKTFNEKDLFLKRRIFQFFTFLFIFTFILFFLSEVKLNPINIVILFFVSYVFYYVFEDEYNIFIMKVVLFFLLSYCFLEFLSKYVENSSIDKLIIIMPFIMVLLIENDIKVIKKKTFAYSLIALPILLQ